MAINPGSDLLSDALAAAEPLRAAAAAERLAKLSAPDEAAPPAFDAVLVAESLPQLASSHPAVLAKPESYTIKTARQDPYDQFEVTMLKSLFELMLPEKADAVFGSGLAGGVWKSMFAQALATEAGRKHITGISHALKVRSQQGKA